MKLARSNEFMNRQTKTRYGVMDIFEKGDLISDFLELYGEWSYLETTFIRSILRPKERILDLGAFLGTFSLSMAKTNPELIVAVEPNPAAFKLLVENLARNSSKNILAENLAIGSQSYVYAKGEYTQSGNLGSLSFEPTNISSAVENNLLVQQISLSKIREKYINFSFIKLDVEGAEKTVIESDLDWIRKNKPTIWAECNENYNSIELYRLLVDLGYDIYFFCYSSINSRNFKKNAHKAFPLAYEAGILAVKKNRDIKIDSYYLRDSKLLKLDNEDSLRRALWHTPRWSKESWLSLSRDELIGVCGRYHNNQEFSTFLIAPSRPIRLTQSKSGSVNLLNLHPEKSDDLKLDIESYLNVDIQSFELVDLLIGCKLLSQKIFVDSDKFTSDKIVELKHKIVDMIEHSIQLAPPLIQWRTELYQTTCLELATEYNLKFRALELDELFLHKSDMCRFACSFIEKFLGTTSSPPNWVSELHCGLLAEKFIFELNSAKQTRSKNLRASLDFFDNALKTYANFQLKKYIVPRWMKSKYRIELLEHAIFLSELSYVDDENLLFLRKKSVTYFQILFKGGNLKQSWAKAKYVSILHELIVKLHEMGKALADNQSKSKIQFWHQCIFYFDELINLSISLDLWIQQLRLQVFFDLISTIWSAIPDKSEDYKQDDIEYFEIISSLIRKLFAFEHSLPNWIQEINNTIPLEAFVWYKDRAIESQESSPEQALKYWLKSASFIEPILEQCHDLPNWVLIDYPIELQEIAVLCDNLSEKTKHFDTELYQNYVAIGYASLQKLFKFKSEQQEWLVQLRRKFKKLVDDFMEIVRPVQNTDL